MTINRICIFCGSSLGFDSQYALAAAALAEYLTDEKIGIVYGGSDVGLMRTVADTALERGGEVIGVIPTALVEKEVAHKGLSDLRLVGSMHERKAMMSELSDAFIALPGGYGTLEEFCEVLTWSQLGLQRKACGLLNVKGYYDPLLTLFDRAVKEGFLKAENRQLVVSEKDPAKLVHALRNAHLPEVSKWRDALGPAKPEALR
jgi:uncharacterized protein (TIGR00730 family)